MSKWAKAYSGELWLGRPGDERFVTVNKLGRFAILKMWLPGCGFKPEQQSYGTVKEAKEAGEQWVRGGTTTVTSRHHHIQPEVKRGEGMSVIVEVRQVVHNKENGRSVTVQEVPGFNGNISINYFDPHGDPRDIAIPTLDVEMAEELAKAIFAVTKHIKARDESKFGQGVNIRNL